MTEDVVLKESKVKSTMLVIGQVAVNNAQMVSQKFLAILSHIFTAMETDHEIWSIAFNDCGFPKDAKEEPLFGILIPGNMGVVLNLTHHYNKAYDVVADPKCPISLPAALWHSMFVTIFHEIHHAKVTLEKGADVLWTDELENEANNWALKKVVELAKAVNMELPPIEQEPFFGPLIKQFYELVDDVVSKGEEGNQEAPEDLEWATKQQLLKEKNAVYVDSESAEEPVFVESFREWMRLSSDDKDAKEWNTPVGDLEAGVITDPGKVADVQQFTTTETTPAGAQQTLISDDDVPFDYAEDSGIIDIDSLFPGGNNGYTATGPEASSFQPPTPEPASIAFGGIPTGNTTTPTTVQPNGWVNPVQAAMAMGDGHIQTMPPGMSPGEVLQPVNLSGPEQEAIMKEVWMRLYNHVFIKCGFDPNAPTTFTNVGAVLEPVNISDIPNVDKLVVGMDTVDEQGTSQHLPFQGFIKGRIFHKSGLPGYWVYINAGGRKVKRTFVPQNPNKTKDGVNQTPMAMAARNGTAIAWIIADEILGDGKMKVKVETQPNGPTTYVVDPFVRQQ